MDLGLYILDGKTPLPEKDCLKWAEWIENHRLDRVVAKTTIGNSTVSTVFLGLDYNQGGSCPHLFETMVFGGDLDEACVRCSTWEQAEEQHSSMMYSVVTGLDEDYNEPHDSPQQD